MECSITSPSPDGLLPRRVPARPAAIGVAGSVGSGVCSLSLTGLTAVALFAGALSGCSRPATTAPPRPAAALAPIGSSGTPRLNEPLFTAALPGYRFHFPRDSGSHPSYKTEWWYYTGHLKSGGRSYGFELTFFRVGLLPHPPHSRSRWATSDLFMAHFAITDVSAGKFHFTGRVDRGALGLSGADTAHENVWIQDWYARVRPGPGDPALWTQEIQASAPFGGIRLSLFPLKRPVIQGRNGVSLKGPAVGEASHYYSYTRLAASGALTTNGQSQPVKGLVWMDHEFSSSALAANEEGWDWFSIQLNNGWDLMLYELRLKPGRTKDEGRRTKDEGPGAGYGARGAGDQSGKASATGDPSGKASATGDQSGKASAAGQKSGTEREEPGAANGTGESISPFSSGALVAPDGSSVFLTWKDFRLTPHGSWNSPRSGAVYPSDWEIHVPYADLDLQETPALADQELSTGGATGVVYWEGAMRVRGTQRGRNVTGEGYTELTGYGASLQQLR